MRLFAFLCLLITISSSCSTFKISVPPGETIVLRQDEYDVSKTVIKNQSTNGLDVSVSPKGSDEQLRGFGLGPRAKATVAVERSSELSISNNNDKKAYIKLQWKEGKSVKPASTTYVSFTLANKSAKSIPLIIPTVMNPNLSPFSRSGVDLKIGQEILFKYKGKKRVLLTVDESIQDGDVLEVAALLKKRKKEIDGK